jgi:UDP-N-acetylglucosamine--N-acetylmuramyl-(pentapeptide) pyrophosphoryl-undecaprenol N-acetylglucosamine transferase
MSDLPRIVLTGGISGGHTFPLVAVARALRKQFPPASPTGGEGVEFLFLGPQGRFEVEAMTKENIPTHHIATGKWRRYFSFQNFTDLFRIPVGFVQALSQLYAFMPEAVFSKGGAASVPVVLAARVLRIPVVLHDSDAVAGRANRFLSRFAERIAIAYPSAKQYFPERKTAITGNPVREEIMAGDADRAAAAYGLSRERQTLLVLGGSQGAYFLNAALLKILPDLLSRDVQVIHQSGADNYEAIEQAIAAHDEPLPNSSYYVIKPFFQAEELADAFALSTLVLSRAGAGSIAEIAAVKKPSILVPLASAANDEQRMNAYDVAEVGGALVLEEANMGKNMLFENILELLGHPETLASMSEKINAFHHPDAADAIASGIREIITKKQ